MKKSLLLVACLTALSWQATLYGSDTLNTHPVRLDAHGKLLFWVEPQRMAYDRVMRLAWDFLLHSVPVEPNGLKTYFAYCCMDSVGQHTQD